MTLKERYIAGLKVLGYQVLPRFVQNTTLITMYNPTRSGPTVFVGLRGNVRQSPTGRLCDSSPLPTDTAAAILRNAPRSNKTKVSAKASLTRKERKQRNR